VNAVDRGASGNGTGPREPLLRVEDLVVEYGVASGRRVHAVSGLTFDVRRGETLGLVGESGCGKSSTARAVMMLTRPTAGTLEFEGRDLTRLSGRSLRSTRRRMHMIFQDPTSSLKPSRRIADIVAEGLAIGRLPQPWDVQIDNALAAVGLDPAAVRDRYPRQLSGGQCQRVALARALVLDPAMVICDEPVSALDVAVQAQILNLLNDMKDRYTLTMLFIAHDLVVVKNVSDRVGVMYLGKLCEIAPSDDLYLSPRHPYTEALLDAIPDPDPSVAERPMLATGDLPSPLDPPSGCRFRTRCPRAVDRCSSEEPRLRLVGPDHYVACHLPSERSSAASVEVGVREPADHSLDR
jgi:peptide/nickel transport system ATP-binding protein